MKTYFRYGAMLAALILSLGLAGCLGDDTTNLVSEVDIPGIPQVTELSSVLDPAHPQTIDGLFEEANQPITVTLSDPVEIVFEGEAITINSLLYDPNEDLWHVTINGTLIVLQDFSSECAENDQCIFIEMNSDLGQNEYGVLAEIEVSDDEANDFAEIYGHYGFLTPIDQMPTTGTGTYYGEFEAQAKWTEADASEGNAWYSGSTTMTVTFGAETDQVVLETNAAGNRLQLDHTATIDGNTFSGTTVGSLDPDASTINFEVEPVFTGDELDFAGTMNGAFYGINAVEAAGTFSAVDDVAGGTLETDATGEIVGGFEVELNDIVPTPEPPAPL